MKTNYIPAITMLSAGLIDCIVAIRMGQELWPFTRQLLIVLLIFYILGSVVKVILDRNMREMDDFEDVQDLEPVEEAETNEEDGAVQESDEDESAETQE